MNHKLRELENKSVFILREVKNKFKKPAVLCSFGKDSVVMLYLIKAAFGNIPFPVIHLDTGCKFPEMYEFRDKLQKELGFELIIAKNEKALAEGMNPKKDGHFECCNALKTENLKMILKENGYDAFMVGIRRDEHGIRNKEHYMSPRDNDFKWKMATPEEGGDSGLKSLQDPEFSGWGIYATEYKDTQHVRVHPLLHWEEIDIWEYTRANNLMVNPLYYSKEGKRFRSLGCMPCTNPVESSALDIDQVIEELKVTTEKERSGRENTKEELMERLRALGYM